MQLQTIHTVYATSADVAINPAEALRYMGAHKDDAPARRLFEECIEKASAAFSYRACFSCCPVFFEKDSVCLPFGEVGSADLSRHLSGCSQVYLLAATVGFSIDRLISKYSALQPSHALAYQAIGAAAIEAWCDQLCAFLTEQAGVPLTSRFSPGYGDFPLSYQRDFLSALDTQRRIGLTLSEGGLMLPTKSVSAIIGIQSIFSAQTSLSSCKEGCANCTKQCAFRKRD